MKILITGGAGFIGSHLARRYVKAGHKVTIIDNLERGKREYIEDIINDVLFIQTDLRSDWVDFAYKEKDLVIHMASKVGGIGTYTGRPYHILKANMEIDARVLEFVIKNKVPNYFYASSAHVYPKELQAEAISPIIHENDAYPANPELTYGWAKLIGEIALKSAVTEYPDLKVAIARFIGIYGANQDYELESGSVIPVFSHRAIRHPEINFNVWGTGKETRSYCYIEDCLDAIDVMVKNMNKETITGPYNVGKEERVTIEDIANTVIEISKKDIDIIYDTTKETVIWGQVCDCTKIKDDLGWEAQTSLKDGLTHVYNDVQHRIGK